MSNEERKAAIREALGHAKVVPVATPKTEGMCCSHCSLKVSTVAPYYPMTPQPMPVNPYSGGQYISSNQLYGYNFQPGNVIYSQSFISSPYPATPSKP